MDRNWITFPPKIFSYYIWIADRVTRDRILLVLNPSVKSRFSFFFFKHFQSPIVGADFIFRRCLFEKSKSKSGVESRKEKKKERGKKREVTISTRENGGGEGKKEKKRKKKSERVGPYRKYTCGVRLTRVKILWQSTLGRIGRCSVYARRRWEPLKYLSPDMVRVSCKADISVAPHINTSKRTVSRALPLRPRTEFRFPSPRVTPERHPSNFFSPFLLPLPLSPFSISRNFKTVRNGAGDEGGMNSKGGELGGRISPWNVNRRPCVWQWREGEHWTLASSDRMRLMCTIDCKLVLHVTCNMAI